MRIEVNEREFMNKYIYSQPIFIESIMNALRSYFNIKNIELIGSSIVKIKIPKPYIKNNNINKNDVKYYYQCIGNILHEFINRKSTYDNVINLYKSDPDLELKIISYSTIQYYDITQIIQLFDINILEGKYLIINFRA